MTMTVHNYRPRQFHRTSNGENPSSGYRDMGSASLAAARPPARPSARTVTTIPLQPGGLRGKKQSTWGHFGFSEDSHKLSNHSSAMLSLGLADIIQHHILYILGSMSTVIWIASLGSFTNLMKKQRVFELPCKQDIKCKPTFEWKSCTGTYPDPNWQIDPICLNGSDVINYLLYILFKGSKVYSISTKYTHWWLYFNYSD